MSNLYPNLTTKPAPAGSFDDYDSVIDEFSISGVNSDVSSMHMSEMGGVSVNAGAVSAANSPARGGGGGGGAILLDSAANSPERSLGLSSAGGGGGVANTGLGPGIVGAPQFIPSTVAATYAAAGNNDSNDGPTPLAGIAAAGAPPGTNPNESTSTNSTSFLNTDRSGFYHVGDYHVGNLGIDTTDVSAILGVASEDAMDEESLLLFAAKGQQQGDATSLADATAGGLSDIDGTNAAVRDGADDQHSLPPVDSVKNNAAIAKNMQLGKFDVEDQHEARQLGPLGDEMSYAEGDNPNMMIDNYSEYDSDDDEEEENDGILPNWLAFSSQRTKCLFVTSTALILGCLVLAIVALGVTYGTGGSIFSSGNDGSGESSEAIAVDRVESDPNNNGGANTTDEPSYFPTLSPVEFGVTSAPVLSTTGEEGGSGSTGSPTPSNTDAIDADSSSSLPTMSPREPIEPATLSTSSPTSSPGTDEPTISLKPTVSPSTSFEPTSVGPTLLPTSKPSASPTGSPRPTISSMPTATHSVSPTLSLAPSDSPTDSPTSEPSLVPSVSSKPSWSFGDDAIEEGEATFYLMADGGSNWQFWTDKMENLALDEDQKFLVHLGSATRVVDNCDPTAYFRTQLSLSTSPIPVYSVPGNNDYPECPDPEEGWANYEKHMMNLDTMYWNATGYEVKRQDVRPENFSFLYKRVLFIGLNTVTNSNDRETTERLEESIDWVTANVEAYMNNADAVFIMGYGRLLATENIPFYEAMVNKTGTDWSDKLVVYARRASETDLDENVGGNENFLELRVGAEWPIMDVRVRTKGKEPKLEFRAAVDSGEPKI